MNLSISPETQRLLEEQMKKGHFATADDVLRTALEVLDRAQRMDYDDLDEATRQSIEVAEAEYHRGEARAWEDVREEIRARFVRK